MRPPARLLVVVASTLTLFIVAFPAVLADFGPGPLFFYRLLVFPADVSLAVATIAVAVWATATRVRPGPGVALLGVLTATLAIALAVHPSGQGLFTVGRFVGATALAYAVSSFDRNERLLAAGALATGAIIELGLALAQVVHGGPLGLPELGETADPLLDYGAVAPRGTMHGQYVLAGLAVVAALVLVRVAFERRWPLLWTGIAGVVAIAVGLTYSRAVALGLALAMVALGLAVRRSPRIAVAAIVCLALGAGTAAVIDHAGWERKAGEGASANGRDILVDEAFAMIASAPLTGIGPGRSVFELQVRYRELPAVVGYQPVHNLPLLAAVEGGVLSGAVAVALLVVLAWGARRDPRALALFAGFVTVVLTDHYPYTDLQGVVLLAMWVGTLDGLSAREGSVAGRRPAERSRRSRWLHRTGGPQGRGGPAASRAGRTPQGM